MLDGFTIGKDRNYYLIINKKNRKFSPEKFLAIEIDIAIKQYEIRKKS